MRSFRQILSVAAVCAAAFGAQTALAFPVEIVVTDTTPGDFWIGLSCDEVSDALRAHIDLPTDEGIIVRMVFPDSAAANAGFKVHDILLKAGKAKLKSSQDLADAVQDAKENSLTFEVLRKGKKTSIEATPQKRPAELRWTSLLGPQSFIKIDPEQRKLIEQLMKQHKDHRILMLEPGRIVAKDWPVEHRLNALPNGVSVSISKTNNEPAKIKVTRGDESWEVTEDELDKLPEDLRPAIQGMLNNNGALRLRVRQAFNAERKDDNVEELSEELRRLAEKIENLEKEKNK